MNPFVLTLAASLFGGQVHAADVIKAITLINGDDTITLGGTTPTETTPFDFGNGKTGYFKAGSLQSVIVPEPATALLAGLGLLALGCRRR